MPVLAPQANPNQIIGGIHIEKTTEKINLNDYGFSDEYLAGVDSATGLSPARVIAEHKSVYALITEQGELPAHLSGKYLHTIDEKGGKPTVGDFVLVQITETGDRAVIHDYLPRKTLFMRTNGFGKMPVQAICANFDTVFICMSLNKDFNLARLERYLFMARESGGEIAVVLTKADICPDAELQTEICRAVAGDVPVICVSAVDGSGMNELSRYFEKGKTVVALGSSGVGKSTLVNAIAGRELMHTAEIREDDSRGRHTTTHRQLITLPSGGLYMDTPGMRELGIYDAEEAVSEYYTDIEELIGHCRFSDCGHTNEPGCAVRAAIRSGSLTAERFKDYQKYLREALRASNRARYTALQQKRIKAYNTIKKANKKK